MKIDFFARRTHYIDHLAPIWRALDGDRGLFYVPESLAEHAVERCGGREGIAPLKAAGKNDPTMVTPPGQDPLVVCAYGDLGVAYARNAKRRLVLQEHGVGITFPHPGYAGGLGIRKAVSLFLAPNEFVKAKTAKTLPNKAQAVIGTPKMDKWSPTRVGDMADARSTLARPRAAGDVRPAVACISFHWDGRAVAPEAGNALLHYKRVLPELAEHGSFKLIGHAHPRIYDEVARIYERAGIEAVRDFEEVMERADIYINDCSSTLYEFCVTGKPVVILNAPQFRRNMNGGIRFWLYSDVGPQVDEPEELLEAIEDELPNPQLHARERQLAVRDLFPYLGHAAERAANVLRLGIIGGYASVLDITADPHASIPAPLGLRPLPPFTGTEMGEGGEL